MGALLYAIGFYTGSAAEEGIGNSRKVGLGVVAHIIDHYARITVVFDELSCSGLVAAIDVDADAQPGFRHTCIYIGLQPSGIIGAAIGHFPAVVEDIAGF